MLSFTHINYKILSPLCILHSGKEYVAVVVHDFPWPLHVQTSHQEYSPENHANIKKAHMESFRVRQPTTFKCSNLAMICGKLDQTKGAYQMARVGDIGKEAVNGEMDTEDWLALQDIREVH